MHRLVGARLHVRLALHVEREWPQRRHMLRCDPQHLPPLALDDLDEHGQQGGEYLTGSFIVRLERHVYQPVESEQANAQDDAFERERLSRGGGEVGAQVEAGEESGGEE